MSQRTKVWMSIAIGFVGVVLSGVTANAGPIILAVVASAGILTANPPSKSSSAAPQKKRPKSRAKSPAKKRDNESPASRSPTNPIDDTVTGGLKQALPVKTRRPALKDQLSRQKVSVRVPPHVALAARNLRATAVQLELSISPFLLEMNPVGVVRNTSAQQIVGPGLIRLTREGVFVAFRNQNSAKGVVRKLSKTWDDVMGIGVDTPHPIYFSSDSVVRFVGLTESESVRLSAIWEILLAFAPNNEYGGGFPQWEQLPSFLRQTSRFLEEHPDCVQEGKVEWGNFRLKWEVPKNPNVRMNRIPTSGDVFHENLICEPLGKGGFGEVFLTRGEEGEADLHALKLMKPRGDFQPWSDGFIQEARTFLDEAQLSSLLVGSPFVVSSVASGLEPWPWIAYPLVSNGIAVSKLIEQRSVNENEWWNIAHDLVSAIYSIHREGIIHRDIHFNNVLVLKDRSVVLDFGISHVEGHAHLKSWARAWPFTSPEILASEAQGVTNVDTITPATDIFSAGIVLYQLLRRESPWPHTTSQVDHLYNLLNIQPDFTGIPAEQSSVLQKMLSRDPASRPSAHDLLIEIAPHVDLEAKTRMMEEESRTPDEADNTESSLTQGAPYPSPPDLVGPLVSWKGVAETVEWIIQDVRPRFWVMDIYVKGKPGQLYFQGITDGDSWVVEAMSEKFADRTFDDKTKLGLLALGWTAPTSSSPNYQQQFDGHPASRISQILSDCLEFGYGIELAAVKRIKVTIQGSQMYEIGMRDDR